MIQPELELRSNEKRHQSHGIPAQQSLLDLSLKLRVEHLRGKHEARARENVFGQQPDALWQQLMRIDKRAHRAEQALAQTGFVRAAGRRRNQIDVRLARHRAVFGPHDDPVGALAFGKRRIVGARESTRLERRQQRIVRERAEQIFAQPTLVAPALDSASRCSRFFNRQCDLGAGQQHGLAAQQPLELVDRNLRRVEILLVRPHLDSRTARLVGALGGGRLQRLYNVAIRERDRMHLAVAPDRDLQARCQRVGDRNADPVQAAGKRICTAGTLVKLAARVQSRENDFDDGLFFFGMQTDRNAAAIVLDGNSAVLA